MSVERDQTLTFTVEVYTFGKREQVVGECRLRIARELHGAFGDRFTIDGLRFDALADDSGHHPDHTEVFTKADAR